MDRPPAQHPGAVARGRASGGGRGRVHGHGFDVLHLLARAHVGGQHADPHLDGARTWPVCSALCSSRARVAPRTLAVHVASRSRARPSWSRIPTAAAPSSEPLAIVMAAIRRRDLLIRHTPRSIWAGRPWPRRSAALGALRWPIPSDCAARPRAAGVLPHRPVRRGLPAGSWRARASFPPPRARSSACWRPCWGPLWVVLVLTEERPGAAVAARVGPSSWPPCWRTPSSTIVGRAGRACYPYGTCHNTLKPTRSSSAPVRGLYNAPSPAGLGLSARVYGRDEGHPAAPVAGTAIPRACDVEKQDTHYSFSTSLQQHWTWTGATLSAGNLTYQPRLDRFEPSEDLQLSTRGTTRRVRRATKTADRRT